MKINRTFILLALLGMANINSIFAESSSQPQIKQVIVGPQGKDSKNNFSLNIYLHMGNETINKWKFGFYMPRNFRQTGQSNRNLTMRICEQGRNSCSQLIYVKPSFAALDQSTVFTTIVKPEENYPLQAGKIYIISLLHNSSRSPQNYSSLPQSMFITNKEDVVNLVTSPASYMLTDFNPSQAKQKAQQKIIDNWANSTLELPQLNVIPAPRKTVLKADGTFFKLPQAMAIHNLSQLNNEQLKLWTDAIKTDLNITPDVDQVFANRGLLLENRDSKVNNPEGYEIEINEEQIDVKASNPAGFFYALQTLRQLWSGSTNIPSLTIQDYPRYKYRGILLDVARHYFTVDEIKNFIDIMASAKLNTLHLHLSDDEGFRLQLDDFPDLIKIGAKRGLGNNLGPMALIQKNLSKSKPSDKLPNAATTYQGSYSITDIQEIINYANLHQITVIPEIDIPGHSRALMKALPDAFYEKEDTSDYAGYGDNSLPVCAYGSTSELGQKFTSTLTNIIYRTSQMFNQQTTLFAVNNEISIGGDEVFSGTWDNAPSCKIAPWNNMNELEKEHYFLDSLNNDARINRLKLSGWYEFVLDKSGKISFKHGIKPDEIGHVWVWGRSNESIKKAVTLANAEYPVVLEYSDLLYMDMTYTPELKEPGLYWANKSQDTYAMLSAANAASQTELLSKKPENIIGLEGAIWTDVIPSYYQLQYMALPKLAGLAEASWSTPPEDKPAWHSLASRLGCGQKGFLAYIHNKYDANYRGYPNGIKLEAPEVCKY